MAVNNSIFFINLQCDTINDFIILDRNAFENNNQSSQSSEEGSKSMMNIVENNAEFKTGSLAQSQESRIQSPPLVTKGTCFDYYSVDIQ